jgi:hypothetical protein
VRFYLILCNISNTIGICRGYRLEVPNLLVACGLSTECIEEITGLFDTGGSFRISGHIRSGKIEIDKNSLIVSKSIGTLTLGVKGKMHKGMV